MLQTHDNPMVSFLMATRNRRAVVGATLEKLQACGLDRQQYEVVVVDNASTDGTAEAIEPSCDLLIRSRRNYGSCAKSLGVQQCRGRFIVFLDDDSFPRPGAIARMIQHFGSNEKLGAAGFTVHLPDGRQEGAAVPHVFIGCGVGLRAEALREAGGLDRSFFMQAEEYDLAFRITGAGWQVRMSADLHVEHLKTVQARRSERTTYYDVRNNLRVAARYLPSSCYKLYRDDWLQRYEWMAENADHGRAFARGRRAGWRQGLIERWTYRRHRLTPHAFEQFFRNDEIAEHIAKLSRDGITRIVFADMGKNILAYHRAAELAGIDVLAIGDDGFAAAARQYRGIPIVSFNEATRLDVEAVVVANSSPVHGSVTWERVRKETDKSVHHWFLPVGEEASDTADDPATRFVSPAATKTTSALHACRAS